MALILNIDTATEVGSVCLSSDNEILGYIENNNQKEHASFIHIAVNQLLALSRKRLEDLDAVAVTGGPGSYTGLRVAMSAAKGFCYALSIPLIAVNTLKVMAMVAQQQYPDCFICPMIDARRMEVFTALYNSNLSEIVKTGPAIIDEDFLKEYICEKRIVFIGNGMNKFKIIQSNKNCIFCDSTANATHLALASVEAYRQKLFADVTYAQPLYTKEFFQNIAIRT